MNPKLFLGIDIGGTKCAVVLGRKVENRMEILDKIKFPTLKVDQTISRILSSSEEIIRKNGLSAKDIRAAGISCGNPLDSHTGIIMAPPNIPDWIDIPIVRIVCEKLNIPAFLQNDANACTLAEWKYGAGMGSNNLIFLTFGTGIGAGLILNGRLYEGTNGNAGEVGHIRLNNFGPVGYGKAGSFEGFCSGGGIRQLALMRIKEIKQSSMRVHSQLLSEDEGNITAEKVATAAINGDETAKEIYQISARFLGIGLSILIDVLNPEIIIIGSIFSRAESLFQKEMMKVIRQETLPQSNKVCKILPAALGDKIGDFAALSIADTQSEHI